MNLKVLAIRTDFSHHGENSGYKQILKFTKPFMVVGINERDPHHINRSIFLKKYPWIFEFIARKFRKKVDLVHILYAEDYYRWSGSFFKGVPVVATFHQPAEMLEREVLHGDFRGRIGKFTHFLSKNRFKKLAAAIVTNPSQAEVLKKVMPAEKIHHIPLGIYLDKINEYRTAKGVAPAFKKTKPVILTVGIWLRDWDFYFQIVNSCPEYEFALVNKRFEKKDIAHLKQYPNIRFYENISDEDLFGLFSNSDLHFLPVTGFAGSNAFLQGLAFGCPLLMTNINADQFAEHHEFVRLYEKGNLEDAKNKIKGILESGPEEKSVIKDKAIKYATEFSWEQIAERTINLYKSLI